MGMFRNFWFRFRSAITGLFVTREFAQSHPESTVKETVKAKAKKPKFEEEDGA